MQATLAPNQFSETLTRRDPSGAIFALSTIGGFEYRVTINPASCECRGFHCRYVCRHVNAAQARYGVAEKPAPQPVPAKPEICVGDMYPCDCSRCKKGAA